MLALIASFFNLISDLDYQWIGFRKLKPARHENMPLQLVARQAIFYAPLAAIYTALIIKVGYESHASTTFIGCSAFAAATVVCTLHALSAFFWNMRAAELRQLRVDDRK